MIRMRNVGLDQGIIWRIPKPQRSPSHTKVCKWFPASAPASLFNSAGDENFEKGQGRHVMGYTPPPVICYVCTRCGQRVSVSVPNQRGLPDGGDRGASPSRRLLGAGDFETRNLNIGPFALKTGAQCTTDCAVWCLRVLGMTMYLLYQEDGHPAANLANTFLVASVQSFSHVAGFLDTVRESRGANETCGETGRKEMRTSNTSLWTSPALYCPGLTCPVRAPIRSNLSDCVPFTGPSWRRASLVSFSTSVQTTCCLACQPLVISEGCEAELQVGVLRCPVVLTSLYTGQGAAVSVDSAEPWLSPVPLTHLTQLRRSLGLPRGVLMSEQAACLVVNSQQDSRDGWG
ncbi:hypothetical protein EGW08_005526 [Elysia chlorotica]|uniref:Uncharacterized protein n=1 Tax=Elysia chlorotica TaxID=188477 RepID=A0A3S1AAF3_ELYCH|nr:hypothetical protein EGW08_005526 [Elysia chlorotica]